MSFNPITDKVPEPDLLAVQGTEEQLAELTALVLATIRAVRPDDEPAVAETLANEAEILTISLQAVAQYITTRDRRLNAKLRSMLMLWAGGTDLDARVAEYGVRRQVIKPADPKAYPPVPAVKEDDQTVLQRALLAPYGFATTGSLLAYRYHAMTLGERPRITFDSVSEGEVVLRYTFDGTSRAAEVLDAEAVMAKPESGLIDIYLLSRANAGRASDDLMAYATTYLNRADVRLGSDVLTLHRHTPREYRIRVRLTGSQWPGGLIDKAAVERELASYAEASRRFKAEIDPGRIYHLCQLEQTVKRAEVLEPAAPLAMGVGEAPHCIGIEVEVVYE